MSLCRMASAANLCMPEDWTATPPFGEYLAVAGVESRSRRYRTL